MRRVKHCFILAGTALLVACATPAPAPPTTPAAAVTAAVPTPTDKFTVPIGYWKSMVKGQERYCRTDAETGSRISHSTVCYSQAQLEAEAADNQNNISSQIQNANSLGTAVGAGGPTGAR
jgi:hypothetical protein